MFFRVFWLFSRFDSSGSKPYHPSTPIFIPSQIFIHAYNWFKQLSKNIFRTNGILLQHLILGKPKTLWIYCSRQNSITFTHGHMPIPNYPLKITHFKCTIKQVLTNSQSPNGLDNPTKWKDFPTWMHWLTHSRSRMINLNISGFSILGKIQLSHFPSFFLNGRPFFAQS